MASPFPNVQTRVIDFFMTASKLLPEFDDLGTELPGLLQNEHWKTSFVLSVVIFITTGVR